MSQSVAIRWEEGRREMSHSVDGWMVERLLDGSKWYGMGRCQVDRRLVLLD